MCVTGCPDPNIRILGIGGLLDIVKYHQINHQKWSSIFKHLQEALLMSKEVARSQIK